MVKGNYSLYDKDDIERLESTLASLVNEVTNLSSRPEQIILTNDELLTKLNVSDKTLRKWRINGLLTYSQIGRQFFYTLKDVLDMLNANKKIAFR